jgi:hypothetical protein
MGGSGSGTDDVDDGVYSADFVEVYLLDWDGMNGGFGLTQKAKGSRGTGLYVFRERGSGDDGEDSGEGAVFVRVAVVMAVIMIVSAVMVVMAMVV